MRLALIPPLAVAALVLCLAGIAKLRGPAGARRAAFVLGFDVPVGAVRLLALLELVVGAATLVGPVRAAAVAAGVLYLGFAAVSVLLVRKRASCGCFGDGDSPASPAGVALSAGLGVLALVAGLGGVPDVWSLLGDHPAQGVVALVGAAGAAYAALLVYTRLPTAWGAWSGQ